MHKFLSFFPSSHPFKTPTSYPFLSHTPSEPLPVSHPTDIFVLFFLGISVMVVIQWKQQKRKLLSGLRMRNLSTGNQPHIPGSTSNIMPLWKLPLLKIKFSMLTSRMFLFFFSWQLWTFGDWSCRLQGYNNKNYVGREISDIKKGWDHCCDHWTLICKLVPPVLTHLAPNGGISNKLS